MAAPSSIDEVHTGCEELPVLSPPIPNPSSPSLASNEPGSWKKALFPDLKHPKNFRLRFIPPTVRNEKAIGVCQKSAIEGELVILDLTLVGFFLGRKPSFSFVKASLLKQWKIQGNVEVIQMLQGGYAFRFSDVRDRDSILEGDSYFVGGQPLFLRAWDRNIHTGGILGLRNIPLWVSFPGLPLHFWGEEALSTVSSVLGIPLYSDKNTATKARLAFARVCIEFMGSKPLRESITIEDEMGLTYEQKVVYEWKPPHCLSCGVFGHEECAVERVEVEVEKPTDTHNDCYEDGPEAIKKYLQEVKGIPETFRRKIQEEKMDEDAGEGWEQVRVRKKRSKIHREEKMDQIRPGSQRVNPVRTLLSTSHWRRRNPPAATVRKAALLPNEGEFLNFKFCSSPHSGPLTTSGSKSAEKGAGTPPSVPLDSSSSLVDGPSGPTSFGSSAGHTPYPNRLVSLVRELRRRPSRSMNPLVPESIGLRQHRPSSNPSPGSCPLGEILRQEKEPMEGLAFIVDRGRDGAVVEEHGIGRKKELQPAEYLNISGEGDGLENNEIEPNQAQIGLTYIGGQEEPVPADISKR